LDSHGDDAIALELYRGEPPELAVTALSVVPDLEVIEDRVGELDAGVPLLAVEQFDLHPGPERLDHGVVVAVTDAAHRREQNGAPGALGEGPGAKLNALVGVDDRPWIVALGKPTVDRHAERVGHQCGGW